MTSERDKIGYFLFSLDTELAWGHFDRFRPGMFSSDGQRERRAIELLLDMLDEFDITATWALVGHLFYDHCERCALCPVAEWGPKHPAYSQVYEAGDRLWYGADIVELLRDRGSRHEIAFHGYTHKVFDEDTLSAEEARLEIREWLRVARRNKLVPRTVVFPRNKAGYLELFEEAGFICYRGDQPIPRTQPIPLVGRLLNRADIVLQLLVPQVYEPQAGSGPLVNLPASRWLFGMDPRARALLDALGLGGLPIRRIAKGIERAAGERKVIHLWAHPYQFQTQKELDGLRYLLGCASAEVRRGRLRSVGMAELAESLIGQPRGVIAERGRTGPDSRRRIAEERV